jgi:RecB family exonuclease
LITPRRTRLVRVPDLRAFRTAIFERTHASDSGTLTVVPTRSAARQLPGVPRAVTREEFYVELHGTLTNPPRLLTALERQAIAQSSAHEAAGVGDVTFRLRPGLVSEILHFYDQLRRQSQSVARFEDLLLAALGPDDLDSGARRMRQQTRFLANAFRAYEGRVRASMACDEHLLRERLLEAPVASPIQHVVVTVADWIAEPDGLFVVDFDLLARLPGLATIEIVATTAILESGFHERLHRWMPGVEEEDVSVAVAGRPMLITPPDARAESPWWTVRDREEELTTIARRLKADRRSGELAPVERIAVVFKNPLPYLYLASEVFGSAGIPYSASDAFPLAAEPAAAALDLVLETVDANFTRDTLVGLLRSPYFDFSNERRCVSRASVAALDRALSKARYLGDRGRLAAIGGTRLAAAALPAYEAALEVAEELAPLIESGTASDQLRRLLAFYESRATSTGFAPWNDQSSRELRSRAAITNILSTLAVVHEKHHDPVWTTGELILAVRRAIEEQTFELSHDVPAGVQLVDDRAARYGDFDDIFVVGLIEADWPERPRRNIFYPTAILNSLDWPSERDRRSAADAHFLNLVGAARRRTVLSVIALENDALMTRALQLDELPRARLSTIEGALQAVRVFTEEALSLEPVVPDAIAECARPWASIRRRRSASSDPKFHGAAGRQPTRTWSVSALETYIGCPFRFFAQHVLRLEEEPTDEEIIDPRRQGQIVHTMFEQFFGEWQKAGYGAITRDNLDNARELFTGIVERSLNELSENEAALERTRLLGSAAAAGLGEAVFRVEAERATPVVERLLEHRLEGEFVFSSNAAPRQLSVRGKADRVDLLADGTFRLIDYKLGWPPDRRRALQLPIYGVCVEQRLNGYRGRQWTLGEAFYLAFKGPRRVVPLFPESSDRTTVLADAEERLLTTVDAIIDGRFPPTPDDVYRCETCSYSDVCRKDYVGDV